MKIEVYKDEETGEIFFDEKRYNSFKKELAAFEGIHQKDLVLKRKLREDKAGLKIEIADVTRRNNERRLRKKEFIFKETLEISNKVDEIQLQIQKLQSILVVCKSSLKNYVAEASEKFDQENPPLDSKLGNLKSRLYRLDRKLRYI